MAVTLDSGRFVCGSFGAPARYSSTVTAIDSSRRPLCTSTAAPRSSKCTSYYGVTQVSDVTMVQNVADWQTIGKAAIAVMYSMMHPRAVNRP